MELHDKFEEAFSLDGDQRVLVFEGQVDELVDTLHCLVEVLKATLRI